MKIVSLVPSITELLFSLGLDEEVIGITKFCVHPKNWHQNKQRIGGTKNIHIEKIKLLAPDIVIASKEENVKEQVEVLLHFTKAHLTDVKNYKEALQMIKSVGTLVNKGFSADVMVQNIEKNFSSLSIKNKKRAAYFIWKDPWMTVGGDTFINSMMQKAGFENVFEQEQRYPIIDLATLSGLNIDYILLLSEPYPFKEKHIVEMQQNIPHIKIILVDGEMFSWYGSRMLEAAHYFQSLYQSL